MKLYKKIFIGIAVLLGLVFIGQASNVPLLGGRRASVTSVDTITTTGDGTIGGDLTVTGDLTTANATTTASHYVGGDLSVLGRASTTGNSLVWGSVGINTSTPQTALHVYDDSDVSYLRVQGITDGDNVAVLELWDNSASAKKWQFAQKADDDFIFNHYDGTSWTSPFEIEDNGGIYLKPENGNIGLNTTTPPELLTVSAGASATTTAQFGTLGATFGTCMNIFAEDGTALRMYFSADTSINVEAGSCQ